MLVDSQSSSSVSAPPAALLRQSPGLEQTAEVLLQHVVKQMQSSGIYGTNAGSLWQQYSTRSGSECDDHFRVKIQLPHDRRPSPGRASTSSSTRQGLQHDSSISTAPPSAQLLHQLLQPWIPGLVTNTVGLSSKSPGDATNPTPCIRVSLLKWKTDLKHI